MTASIIIPLVLLTLYNGDKWSRSIPCFIVLLVTVIAYQIHPSEFYFPLETTLGFYGYLGIYPLAAIVLMSVFTNRLVMQSPLSTCLISLLAIYIGGIFVLFFMEGAGANTKTSLGVLEFVVYSIELALMFSTKLTNYVDGGIERMYGNIRRYATGRGAAALNRIDHYRNDSDGIHMGSNHQ